MRINDNKALTLILAAFFGSGLVACQRDVEDQTVSREQSQQDSPNQAPRQGYTGPATVTPQGSTSEEQQQQQSTNPQTGDAATTPPSVTPNPSGSDLDQERRLQQQQQQ